MSKTNRTTNVWFAMMEWLLGMLIFLVIFFGIWAISGQMAYENACIEQGGVWEGRHLCTDGDKILFRFGDDLPN